MLQVGDRDTSAEVRNRPGRPRLYSCVAKDDDDILAALRLRHRVFVGEMSAQIEHAERGIERDRFDEHCVHLLVREDDSHRAVGTYRILSAAVAQLTGGFYSETEFDLCGLPEKLDRVVEIGRACVDPEYRNGAVIAMLWAGLFRYLAGQQADYVIGCASVSLAEGRENAAAMCNRLVRDWLAPPQWRVVPRRPFPIGDAGDAPDSSIPALIKGYLRLGAYVCGEPAFDPEFGTADLLMILPMARMNSRYLRHFARTA